MKKEANSLQVDRSLEPTDTGGFVSLSTVAIKAPALLLFLAMMSEKNEHLAFLSYIL